MGYKICEVFETPYFPTQNVFKINKNKTQDSFQQKDIHLYPFYMFYQINNVILLH